MKIGCTLIFRGKSSFVGLRRYFLKKKLRINTIQHIPYKKGRLKDIISPMGWNSPMNRRRVCMRGPVVAPISSMPYQMIVVLGGLGVDMG